MCNAVQLFWQSFANPPCSRASPISITMVNKGKVAKDCGITNRALPRSIRYRNGRSLSIRPENKVRVGPCYWQLHRNSIVLHIALLLWITFCAGKYRPVRDRRPLSTRIVFHLVHSRLQMRTFSSISMLWSRATLSRSKKQIEITLAIVYIFRICIILWLAACSTLSFYFLMVFETWD